VTPLIEAVGLGKAYAVGERTLQALSGIDFAVAPGEFVAVMGPSGSGKSTLLHILGGLEGASAGSCRFAGRDLAALDDDERSRIRAARIGFVFQSFHLLPQLSIAENAALPFLYGEGEAADARARADAALRRVGLADRREHRPAQLSGGEMQRAAIARAIVVDPELLLADEPTGNLDSETGERILAILDELRDSGTTIVLVTHDAQVARHAGRVVTIRDGRIASG